MKNILRHPPRWQAAIPHVIVILWLIFLGMMIWQHAAKSVQPPLYDPLSYMQKAMSFWEAVDKKTLFNPMNIEPTVRPFGTIIMSYPIGFSTDFTGFKFRSVFFPIVCVVFAVYLAFGMQRVLDDGWQVAAIAVLFSSLPLFYSLDYNETITLPYFWGMVDAFQAGIAAIAAAGFVRSLHTRSLSWLIWGAFWGSFTLLIKPSGLMVIALLTMTWLIFVALEWLWLRRKHQVDSTLRSYVTLGGIRVSLIFSIFVAFCIFSDYFSTANFTFAKHALKVMENVLKAPPYYILSMLLGSAGMAFLLWIFSNWALAIYCWFRHHEKNTLLSAKMLGALLSVLFIWILGAWYWLAVQAGGIQIRYFYPFLLMGAIFAIPMMLYTSPYTPRWIRTVILLICFFQALNTGALLALESPPIAWQKFSGLNVSVGQDMEEVNQAYWLLENLRKRGKNANLYSFSSGVLPEIFVNVGIYEKMVRPDLPFFTPLHPIDWINGFGVRMDQLLNVDFILIRKDLAQDASHLLLTRNIDSFHSECAVFQAWLYGLAEKDGVKTVSDGRVLQLLEVVEGKAFARALESFVAAHSWRPEFQAANPQRLWWNEADAFIHAQNPTAKEIAFDGIYIVHMVSLKQSDTDLQVEIWWDELRREEENRDRHLFFHLVDRSGNILRDLYLPLNRHDSPFVDKTWRYGSLTFKEPLPKEATALAFGIFRPNHEMLTADKGARDWGGKRVLLPIP